MAQGKAFNNAKQLISSAPALAYYDLRKPVVLQTDAIDNAAGGAVLQPNDEGKLQPVAFMSSSMNPTEQCYSQIEIEYLAIRNCFQKFDQWLYGKPDIEVHTDHQPLETIKKKPLNKAPAPLQRILMSLQCYQFTVKYKRGPTLCLADTLSRAALPHPIGILRSDDGDGNGNATKATGLIQSKTTILLAHHAFLYISLPSLHDYDVKMPNFTMYRGSTQATTKFPPSF